ncbi:MAG: apolipoprotein N-acyltransferase [Candidatus Planktophila sp.]|nr:apolipoprotein N-acyltransferase [Candidatus Planktophila sp.]
MVNLLLPIVSGILLSGAFAPIALWWLAPISLALHMYSLKNSVRPFFNSFLFAATFNAIVLQWTNIFVGSIPWIILFCGQAVLFMPLGFCKKYGVGFYPLIFLILEQVRSLFPFGGFGWLRLAYSQADAPFSQIAAIGGASALSALTLSIALVLYSLFNSRITLIPLLPLALLLIPIDVKIVGEVQAVMIQGNVPKLGLDFNARATQVFFNHVRETKKALALNKSVDFILWPENAVDVDPFTNTRVRAELNSFDQPLIIGAVIKNNGELLNTSILWQSTGQDIYIKQHLTPFGEYIPLRAIASKISPYVDSLEDFTAGNSSKAFTLNGAKIAPIICFELLDDAVIQRAARNSQLLVVQTNSATFGKSPQNAQQLAITRIRAIEYGREILSVSTTGVSAYIDYHGKVQMQTEPYTHAHLFVQPVLIDGQTPRDKAGDWTLVGSLIWLLFLARGGSSRLRYRR